MVGVERTRAGLVAPMLMRVLRAIAAASLTIACTADAPSTEAPPAIAPPGETASTQARASFINKVWTIAESEQVAVGDLRVFLADGTLVMASSHATPAFGTWSYRGGHLTITEEGRKYPVDILELTRDTFHIRIRGPGDPIVIRFKPAESPQLSGDLPAATPR
jgi:hypothetical protein